MTKSKLGLKAAIVCAVVVGMAQASPIVTLDPTGSTTYWTAWQNIESVSYTWNDINSNNILEVGETIHLDVEMGKDHWGTHNYDVLKVWIDGAEINRPTPTNDFDLRTANNMEDFMWDYNSTLPTGITDYKDGSLSWRDWPSDITKTFEFDYTFTEANTYDLVASVMCSDDLSGLNMYKNDVPTIWDWNNWNTDGPGRLQGQTNQYQITVSKNVPEPSSLSFILLGLSGLAGSLLIRRKNK